MRMNCSATKPSLMVFILCVAGITPKPLALCRLRAPCRIMPRRYTAARCCRSWHHPWNARIRSGKSGSESGKITRSSVCTSLVATFLMVISSQVVPSYVVSVGVMPLHLRIRFDITALNATGRTVVSRGCLQMFLQSNQIAEYLQYMARFRRICQAILACFEKSLA